MLDADRRRAHRIVFALALALCPAAAGCNTTSITLCDRLCDCEVCDQARYDACIADNDALASQAGSACDAQADLYLACAKDNLVCAAGHATFAACAGAYADLEACLGATPCCAAARLSGQ